MAGEDPVGSPLSWYIPERGLFYDLNDGERKGCIGVEGWLSDLEGVGRRILHVLCIMKRRSELLN